MLRSLRALLEDASVLLKAIFETHAKLHLVQTATTESVGNVPCTAKDTQTILHACTSIPKPLKEFALGGHLHDTKHLFTMEQMCWSPSVGAAGEGRHVSSACSIRVKTASSAVASTPVSKQ